MKLNYSDEKYRGNKYGRLTVIGFERIRTKKTSRWNWICRCECGTIKSVNPYRVLDGNTVSCGCHGREQTIKFNKVNKTKHGGRYERLYTIWHSMKQRCYNSNSKDYPNWGGRGVKVCDEWKEDYASFREWAEKSGYTDSLSIDRIDVNKDYSPDNCRWADWNVQAQNRRGCINVEIEGEIKNLAQVCRERGLRYGTVYHRLKVYGWDVERALSAV